MKKQWYIQNISALRALICYEFLKKLHEKSMIFPKMKMEIQLKLMDWLIQNQMKLKWNPNEHQLKIIET